MASAAVDVVLDPQARWWLTVLSLPWCLAGGSVLAWAVLRAREKAARRPPYGDGGRGVRSDWGQAA
ncbi:hypothetical protein [Streptomyces deserti]